MFFNGVRNLCEQKVVVVPKDRSVFRSHGSSESNLVERWEEGDCHWHIRCLSRSRSVHVHPAIGHEQYPLRQREHLHGVELLHIRPFRRR